MSFQIHALDPALFSDVFALSDAQLATRDAKRVRVTANPGFPCRISLEDAPVGEDVILTHFVHQPEPGPYRASHAIYVRADVAQARPEPGTIPELFRKRLMSVRAFDATHAMIAADVVDGTALEAAITTMFSDPNAAYLHLHNAKPGCYAARVTRT